MILDRIKELNNLTYQEKAVVNYLLDHPRDLLSMSISDLALASFTSTSTIVRLCKKAGTRGFSDFKYNYISEYPQMLQLNESKSDIPFSKETNLDEIMHRLPAIYTKTLDLTRSNLDRSAIVRCINLIQKAQHVGIYGTGANFSLALTYQYKMQEMGINAIAYSSPLWTHLSHLKNHSIPSVGIILSATGENPMMIDVARRLKSLNIPTIAICGYTNRQLNQFTTENIKIISRLSRLDYHNLSTSISTHYVMDILLSAIFVKHYDDILNAHAQSNITAEDLEKDKIGH